METYKISTGIIDRTVITFTFNLPVVEMLIIVFIIHMQLSIADKWKMKEWILSIQDVMGSAGSDLENGLATWPKLYTFLIRPLGRFFSMSHQLLPAKVKPSFFVWQEWEGSVTPSGKFAHGFLFKC